MTDKELLDVVRAEILRLVEVRSYSKEMANDLLTFIDSLPNEPVSDDLEEAAVEYVNHTPCFDVAQELEEGNDPTEIDCFTIDDAIGFFKAGAQWKEKQMMSKAVDAELYSDGMLTPLISVKDKDKIDDIKFGDKLKIIIIKQE